MTTRKSLLTEILDNENKMIALVKEYDEKGEGDKIPKKVRERYDTIMKNIKSMKNHNDDYDDLEMKDIEKVTMQNRSASRKNTRNPQRKGGKTKRKRRSKNKKKKKN